MANPEHLAILKKGVQQWNQWRSEHPDLIPALSEADLRQTQLAGVNLKEANLCGANLQGANLDGANLSGADLIEADLSEANLDEANLYGAIAISANLWNSHLNDADLCRIDLTQAVLVFSDLTDADVSHATLREANLAGANLAHAFLADSSLEGAKLHNTNFEGSDLTGADFTEAVAGSTVFADVDLRTVNGLEKIVHVGPSTLGTDTIFKSYGKIPEVFLRGCGVPEEFIRYIESMVGRPIEFYSCFISYSTKDHEFAERLYNDLQGNSVRCWFAPHDIQGGRKIDEQLDEAIRLHDKLLLILSDDSMNSEWVKTEIAKARKRELKEKRKMLFPVSLVRYDPVVKDWECFDADTGKDSAREIREYYIPDFSSWKEHDSYQKAFQRLVGDLKAETKSAAG